MGPEQGTAIVILFWFSVVGILVWSEVSDSSFSRKIVEVVAIVLGIVAVAFVTFLFGWLIAAAFGVFN